MLIHVITRRSLCKPFFDAHEVPLDCVLMDRGNGILWQSRHARERLPPALWGTPAPEVHFP